MKVSRYCICGASEHGDLPPKMAKSFADLWAVQHAGPGHAPCDARTASRARAETSMSLPTDSGPAFGITLRTARESIKLSLRDVEEATGISNAYVSQLESGKVRRPSPVFIRKLATLYGLEYERIMARIYPDPNPLKGYLFPLGKSIKRIEPTASEEQELMDYLTFIRVRHRRALAENRK